MIYPSMGYGIYTPEPVGPLSEERISDEQSVSVLRTSPIRCSSQMLAYGDEKKGVLESGACVVDERAL